MDRNVVTEEDARRIRESDAAQNEAGAKIAGGRRLGSPARSVLEPAKPDSWNQRLLKYIPGEAVGLYIALDRAVRTSPSLQLGDTHLALAAWLGAALLVAVTFNALYLWIIWKVDRVSQIAASTVALVSYVYAMGGMFEPLKWTDPTAQLVAVIVVAAFLVFFEPPKSRIQREPHPG